MAAIAIFLCGCASLNTSNLISFAAARAGEAAMLATQIDLGAHPEHRPYFEVGLATVDRLLGTTNITSITLAEALRSLPVDELRGEQGAILIAAGVSVVDLASMFSYQIETDSAVRQVALSIRNGLAAGLAGTPIRPAASTRALRSPIVPVRIIRL